MILLDDLQESLNIEDAKKASNTLTTTVEEHDNIKHEEEEHEYEKHDFL